MIQLIIVEILSVLQFPLCLEMIFSLSLTVSYFKTFFMIFKYVHYLYQVFLKLIYFLLEDNCFTEFCCFQSNLSMNQEGKYIYLGYFDF